VKRLSAAALIAFGAAAGVAASPRADRSAPVASNVPIERHHYTMSARVRPLLVFWISKSNIGDAMTLRHQDAGGAEYSLLIGSDPQRAPRRINRWGYIEEHIQGPNATLVGLMTESDEDSIEQAQASLRKQESQHVFKLIRGSVAGNQAQSVVTLVPAPSDYDFRQLQTLLDLARTDQREGTTRSVRLAPGTRPGFLAALADLMRGHVEQWRASHRIDAGLPVSYAYHGKIFELRATKTQMQATVKIGSTVYQRAIASEFEIRNTRSGEVTRFAMTYGSEGSLAAVPLTVSFQPRWWLEVDLALDDSTPGPTIVAETGR